MQYRIIYSKRKSIGLTVNRNAEIVVRASTRHPKYLIENFVEQHLEWIQKALERRQTLKKQFAEGEMFLYLGQEFPLRILEGYRSKLVFENGFFLSKFQQHKAKKYFEDFYKQKAKEVLLERSKLYGGVMNASFKKLNITGANTRWGSCSSSGSINFSWRLVMTPLEVIDYVVVHELAHVTHKNHSKKFWDLVGRFYPEYKNARKWLNANGHRLSI